MKRHIVVINQDSGYLVIDIVNELTNRNIDISLITGRLVSRNKQLDKSVKVNKIVKYHRGNKLYRLFTWLLAFLQIFFLLKTKFRNDYLFIFSNPPLSTFIPLICRNRYSLMIFDVYPDILISAGLISTNSFLARFWKRTNRKVFNNAENIFTISESMSITLMQYSGNKEIQVVPLWSDNNYFYPIPKESNTFISEHNLINRFVVMYSGNLGATHNISIFTEIAKKISDQRVIFLIIGEGVQRKRLEERISREKIPNFYLLPLQPVNIIPYSFNAADIAIVSLSDNVSGLSIPSKTFSLMSTGIPLICISGDKSELKTLVEKYKNGRWFPSDNPSEIAAYIELMAKRSDLLQKASENSLRASLEFTATNAGIIAEKICKSI